MKRSPPRPLIALALGTLLPPALVGQTPPRRTALADLNAAFAAVAARVEPAVVEITVTAYGPASPGASATAAILRRERRAGSGVILSPDGYLVTNRHVVEGARRVTVTLSTPATAAPGRSILRGAGKRVPARVVGVDRETDLAVLKVEETGLASLPLGDSDELAPGQLVLAFGSPLGLENSVSLGVVSAVARQLEPESRMIYIQTDATISPGSSGGPLVSSEGDVVGLNTLIFSRSGGSEGIGFAAPSNIVRHVYEQIRAHGRVRRGVIGVYAQTVTPTLARGLKLAQDWGVVLGDVTPGGPAARAGLVAGDIVLTLDGKPMENGRQFDVNVYRRVGETLTLEVLRGVTRLTVRVPVVERTEDVDRFAQLVTPERNLVAQLGILGVQVDRTVAPLLPWLRTPTGVVVAALGADAPFGDEGGLVPGDVIYALNGAPVPTLGELKAALGRLQAGDPVVLQVDRRGQLMFVSLELE